MTERALPEVEAAVEAAAKAFHDAAREKRFLRWETSSEEYRAQIRDVVRPVAETAFDVGINRAAAAVERVGNFGDYRREELTADFSQPPLRFHARGQSCHPWTRIGGEG